MNIKIITSTILLIFCFIIVSAQDSYNGSKENSTLAFDNKIRFGKLDNGFTYYVRDNDSETTEFSLVVKVGLFHEEEDQLEFAHLLEHMVFKYPEHFPPEENYFRSGGRYSHAKTTYPYTFYYALVPTDDKEGISNGFQLLRDFAQLTHFEQASIEVERGAVLGEGRFKNVHTTWVNETVEQLLLKNTNLTFHPRSAYRASIRNFNREDFIKFHNDWYRPDLQAAIVVGDIQVDSAEAKIKRLFSDLEMPDNPRNAQEKMENRIIKLPGENQYITVFDSLSPHLQLYIVSKNRNREFLTRSKKDFREMLLQQIYEKIIGDRSKWFGRQYNPPFSNFTADYAASTVAGGQIFASMMTVDFKSKKKESFYDRFQNALVTWQRIHTGLTEKELMEAKASIKGNYTIDKLKSSVALENKYRNHFVLGGAAPDPEDELALIEGLLEEISVKDMENFISDYGDLSKNTDFIFFTEEPQLVPTKSSLEKQVSKVKRLKVRPPSAPESAIKTLENIVQLPEKEGDLVESSSKSMINVSTITLKNGIKLILKPTKPRSDFFSNKVTIRGIRPNRVSYLERKDYLAAKVVPGVTQFMGGGPYDKFDLERFKEDLGLELTWEMNRDFQIMEGTSDQENVGELLNLFYLYIMKPRKDAEVFSLWKDHKRHQLKKPAMSSGEFYMNEIRSLWNPEVTRLELEDIDQLERKKVFESHDQWYSDFRDFTFIVTGDFDSDMLKSVIIRKLSAFPVKKISNSGKESRIEFPLRKMDKTIRLSNINQAFVKLYFPIIVSKDVKTQVKLDLISKALNNRIWERLREGCYAPTARGEWMDRENGIYAFSIAFNSELDNYDNMIREALEEFQILKDSGVKQQWLDRAIMNEKASFSSRIESFGYFNFWPDYLQDMVKNGEHPEEQVLMYESILEHFVTLEDLNLTMKNYLRKEHYQKFIILPKDFNEFSNSNN